MEDVRITAAEAARLLGVTLHCIVQWRITGKLEIAGYRGRRPEYRLLDLQLIERATRRSGKSHRGPHPLAADAGY